jgi:hypothetical protein
VGFDGGKNLNGEIDFGGSGKLQYTLTSSASSFPHHLCGLFVRLMDIVERLHREMGGIEKIEIAKKP